MNRYWLASILLVSSCGSTHKEGAGNKAATTVSVSTDRVSLGRAAQTAQATGTVQPRTRTVISAQVAGLIRRVLVEPGQSVQAGQTLLLIDSQQLLAGESQAAAARLEATGGLAESERAIDSARTQLDLAKSPAHVSKRSTTSARCPARRWMKPTPGSARRPPLWLWRKRGVRKGTPGSPKAIRP